MGASLARIDEPECDGVPRETRHVVDADAFHDARAVVGHRLLAQPQRAGDLLGALALRDVAQDLPLALGELLVALGLHRGLAEQLTRLARVVDAARRDALDGLAQLAERCPL